MDDAVAALISFSEALGQPADLEALLARALSALRKAGAERAAILVHAEDASAPCVRALDPGTENALRTIAAPGRCTASAGDALAASIGATALPLEHGGRRIGALIVAGGARTLDVARALAGCLALALAHRSKDAELEARQTAIGSMRDELSSILASVTEAIVVHDVEGRLLYVNEAAAHAIGAPSAEALVGRMRAEVLADIEFFDERGDAQPPHTLPGERSRGLRSPVEATIGLRRAGDSDVRWFEERATPVLDSAGEVRFVAIALRDVTEHRRALHAAREAEQRKDAFLAILGHELRNPLSPIVTALQLMEMDGGPQFSRERAIIGRQVRHMLRLVDDLLDVSRITRGKLELQRATIDLRDVVRRAIETVSPLLEQRRHRLTVELANTELLVDADAMRLGQVFSNLLTNAAKYTEPGGDLSVRAERAGAAIAITICDSGIGIEPALMPHLFEPFVQGGQSLARSRGGLGLGLTIVRQIVDMHGGSIRLESLGAGRGTTACVELPVATLRHSKPASAPHLPFVGPNRALGAVRVLVVDDNADAADTIATSLSALGYRTAVAYDGPSAIERAAVFGPHVAVLDIGLPVIDGYEVAARLRESHAAVRLVALTGYGQAVDRERAYAAGFDVHLVKPIDLGTLISSLAAKR